MESIYGNIGRRIKWLAFVLFVFWSIICIFVGLFILVDIIPMGDSRIIYSLLWIILGPVLSFIATWLLYGFGQLIENTSDINEDNYLNGKILRNISNSISKINSTPKGQNVPQKEDRVPNTSADIFFIESVEKSSLYELEKLAETFDDPHSVFTDWQKEYVYQKIDCMR